MGLVFAVVGMSGERARLGVRVRLVRHVMGMVCVRATLLFRVNLGRVPAMAMRLQVSGQELHVTGV